VDIQLSNRDDYDSSVGSPVAGVVVGIGGVERSILFRSTSIYDLRDRRKGRALCGRSH